MVVAEGRGSRIRDMSGNEYIDYMLGSGAMILGHAHPAVVAAVGEAAGRGSSFLMPTAPAIRLAERIVGAVPAAEQVCFHSSGSESVLFALRLARAFTGREKVLKFEGGFHGMSDYALMSNQWTAVAADLPRPFANSAGIPRSVASEVLVAPFNDLETTRDLIEPRAAEIAAVIVEPLQRTIPPQSGFLEGLKGLAGEHGIVLIFDEMVTGFRLAWGGAQEYYGVVPDLCVLGKSISGGHPLSVLCGRADILSLVDPATTVPEPAVMQTSTFSGNPVSTAAALAVMDELSRPGTYERLYAAGRRLMEGLGEALVTAGLPVRVTGEPSVFEVWFTDVEISDFRSAREADRGRHRRFTELLLDRGVVKAHEKFFLSTAHTDEDVELTLEAFRTTARSL